MTAACATPLAWAELVDYWAGDLEPSELDRLDEHLLGCGACAEQSARVSAVTETVRGLIPPFVDHARMVAFRARGLRVKDNPIQPGSRTPVVFNVQATDILLHRLVGLDLSAAERVGIQVTFEETGQVALEEPDVPFDRDSGEVLIACQRHFAAFPPNIVAEVTVHHAAGRARVARYAIPHVWEEVARLVSTPAAR